MKTSSKPSAVVKQSTTPSQHQNDAQAPKSGKLSGQKATFWQQRSSVKQSEQSSMMVPCINCEELIPIDAIDKHSQKCTQVSKRVVAVAKSSQLYDEIDFKIMKLKESLLQLIDQVQKKEIPQKGASEQTEKKLKYLCRACEIANAIMKVQTIGQNEERKLRDMEDEVRILSSSYSGSLGIALYIERLHSLILQKLSVITRQQINVRVKNEKPKIEETPTQLKSMNHIRSNENLFHIQPAPAVQLTQEEQKAASQRSDSKNSKYSYGSSQATNKDQLKTLINEKKQEVNQIKNIAYMYQDRTQKAQQLINNVMNININNYVGPQQQVQPSQQNARAPSYVPMDVGSSSYLSPDIQNGRPTLITKFSGSYDRSNQQEQQAQKSEILTQISSSQWDQEVNHLEDYQNTQQFQSTNDQLQRIFYSKCLNQKMKLPSNHPSQKIPVSVLFKEACQRKIPQQHWDQYIAQALQSPYEYLDMNKVNQAQNTKVVKNGLREMAHDNQFKNRLQYL